MTKRPIIPPGTDTIVFALLMVVAAMLGRENPDVAYPDILWAFLGLLLGSFLTLFLFPKSLPETKRMTAAVGLNIIWLTLIIDYSGGERSYFWVLYLLPVFHSCLTFGRFGILAVSGSVVALLVFFHRDSLRAQAWAEIMALLVKSMTIIVSSLVVMRVAFEERSSRHRLDREQRNLESERLRMRDKLQHMDRLATLGELAASVAHELTAPLASIQGYVELSQAENLSQPLASALAGIERAAVRCSGIIKSRLSFARSVMLEREPCDVNSLVRECVGLKGHDWLVDGITVEEDYAEGLPKVLLSGPEFQQVVFNLLGNSQQALRAVSLTEPRITVRTALQDGAVVLSIEDNGPGVPAEIADRIWEPFYTTKGAQGTGLGLAICRTIILSHGGKIALERGANGGTAFSVALPVLTGS